MSLFRLLSILFAVHLVVTFDICIISHHTKVFFFDSSFNEMPLGSSELGVFSSLKQNHAKKCGAPGEKGAEYCGRRERIW